MDTYSDVFDSEYTPEIESFCSQFDIETPLDEDFTLTKKQERDRFALPVGKEQSTAIQESRIPANTRKSTNWGVSVWDAWGRGRNERVEKYNVSSSDSFITLPSLCHEIHAKELTFWLCFFVSSWRCAAKTEFPPSSLRVLCSAIQRYLRDECPRSDLRFMDTQCLEFIEFHKTLDGVLKYIDKRGISLQKRQAATTLSYAAYLYVCKIFALRAVDEHSNLTVEQSVKGTDKDGEYIEFCGRPCENNQGYAATSLYEKGFDEQLIKERTGYRSDDGLRTYTRTSTSLQKTVSDALQPPNPVVELGIKDQKERVSSPHRTQPMAITIQSESRGFFQGISIQIHGDKKVNIV
uniref:Uncharacterized protein LOC102807994 n=1 Tax=Saccoglossus kowalevskii TaxID=10224 RepID=A0ABM0MVR5_SACKO|nr:PREDICTED: uncharacterized protein LOC102807994 [Saccoglossus kowalevskii]